MEPGGEAASVIDIERIAIERNERRGKTGIDMVGCFLFYSNIVRIARSRKSNKFEIELGRYKEAYYSANFVVIAEFMNVYLKLSVAA